MKPIKVTGRKGQRYVPIRLRAGLAAIVFELSNGTKIEVDLMESTAGNLLIRAHDSAVSVAQKSGSIEVIAGVSARIEGTLASSAAFNCPQ